MHNAVRSEIIEVLKLILSRLKNREIKWVLVGSASLALQGMEINPKDIDILTNKKGAFEIDELPKEYEVEPVEYRKSELFQSFLGEFVILNMKVDVMGSLKERFDNEWVDLSPRLLSPKIIEIRGMTVPVSSLHEQQRANERLGREKDSIRVQKIREFLERRGLKHRSVMKDDED